MSPNGDDWLGVSDDDEDEEVDKELNVMMYFCDDDEVDEELDVMMDFGID